MHCRLLQIIPKEHFPFLFLITSRAVDQCIRTFLILVDRLSYVPTRQSLPACSDQITPLVQIGDWVANSDVPRSEVNLQNTDLHDFSLKTCMPAWFYQWRVWYKYQVGQEWAKWVCLQMGQMDGNTSHMSWPICHQVMPLLSSVAVVCLVASGGARRSRARLEVRGWCANKTRHTRHISRNFRNI